MDPAKWKQVKTALADAIEMTVQTRAKFVDDLDESIRDDVKRLLDANENATDFISRPIIIDSEAIDRQSEDLPKQIDEFHIISQIGTGGMGTVFLAEHEGEGFTQRVALKLIKRGMDTGVVMKRFLMERRILASLDHPNIARMLDGGSTSDGLPYFVMEYVEGSEIRKYCNENELGLNERLELFCKVCSAVQSAHQKLVVHRDLKPTNILVTKDGEPKLLDFGIAKLISPDWNSDLGETTLTQFRVLTPEYASPEQTAGRPTSTSTDVYSLGILLYELLTGRRPHAVKGMISQEIADSILTVEPPKPSTVFYAESKESRSRTEKYENGRTNSNAGDTREISAAVEPRLLRGDLDNIVMKAIRREPERRYQSVQELSEDIRRFLDGLPVNATADSRIYRFGKFFKRHRAGVLASAVAAVLLVTATAVTGWQYSVAQSEKAKAEKRFQEVRKLANTVLFDHYERIKELPGATEARAKLVSDALQYLDMLAADSGDNPEILREVAVAYTRLAEIQNAERAGGNLGEAEASKENYQKALDIWERIDRLGSGNPLDRRELANSYMNASYLYEAEPDMRRQFAQRAVDIFRELLTTHPDKTKARSDYSTALWEWANIVRLEQGNAAAITVYEESVALREELIGESTENQKEIGNASLTYKNLGTLYALEKNFERSLEYYRKAFEMDTRLIAETPENVRLQLALSFSHKGIGKAYLELGDLQKAIDEHLKAIEIQGSVYSKDPKNNFAARNLAGSYSDLAAAYYRAGRMQDAESLFKQAIAAESARNNEDTLNKLQKAVLFLGYGQFLLNEKGKNSTGNKLRAVAELRKAESIFSELKRSNTLDPAYQNDYDTVRKLLK